MLAIVAIVAAGHRDAGDFGASTQLDRRLVLVLDVQPNATAMTSSTVGPSPAPGLATMTTAQLTAQIASRRKDWLRTRLMAARRWAGSGSAPATNQRNDGAMLR
jgi:hypothetical protein